MERKDIEEKYTWDLSKIYQDPQEFYHDIEVSEQLLDELNSFQGKLTESIETLLRFLSKRDEMSMLISKAYCFAHVNFDVEPKNQEYQKMLATVMSLIQQSSVKLVFVDNEIVENDEKVKEYLNMNEDDVILHVCTTAYTKENEAVEVSIASYHGQRNSFTMKLTNTKI